MIQLIKKNRPNPGSTSKKRTKRIVNVILAKVYLRPSFGFSLRDSGLNPKSFQFSSGDLLFNFFRAIFYRRLNEFPEKWMGVQGPALEFGVELHPNEPGMVGQFDHLHQVAVG